MSKLQENIQNTETVTWRCSVKIMFLKICKFRNCQLLRPILYSFLQTHINVFCHITHQFHHLFFWLMKRLVQIQAMLKLRFCEVSCQEQVFFLLASEFLASDAVLGQFLRDSKNKFLTQEVLVRNSKSYGN